MYAPAGAKMLPELGNSCSFGTNKNSNLARHVEPSPPHYMYIATGPLSHALSNMAVKWRKKNVTTPQRKKNVANSLFHRYLASDQTTAVGRILIPSADYTWLFLDQVP